MAKNITIYSTPTCPWCIKVKDYLKEQNVEYSDKDVSTDSEAAKEMYEKTQQRGVPVIDIDGKIIIGFDKEEIDNALK